MERDYLPILCPCLSATCRTLPKTMNSGSPCGFLRRNRLVRTLLYPGRRPFQKGDPGMASLIDTIYLRPRLGDGRVPYGIAVNPETNLVYTANSATNNVTVIDAGSNDVVAVYSAGQSPS